MRQLDELTHEIAMLHSLLSIARQDESTPDEVLYDIEDQLDDLEFELKYHRDINIRNEGEYYDEDFM